MEDLEDLEIEFDLNSWGPKTSQKPQKNIFGIYHYDRKGDMKGNNKYIKGLCDVFLREKKTEDKDRDIAVNFEVVEVKQQAKKNITSQKKYTGQRNNNARAGQEWNEKNKANRPTGKRTKMNNEKRRKEQKAYNKEYKAKGKSYKELSVKIHENWKQIDEVSYTLINSLPKFSPGAPEIMHRAGKIGEYNLDFDSVNTSNKVKIQTLTKIEEVKKSTNEIELDSHIYEIIDSAGIAGTIIIASDMVLAALMNFSKSVYSWDIEVKKEGDYIYFDKREISENEEFVAIDLESVAENSTTPPPANPEDKAKKVEASLEINTAVPLMKEATKVLHTVQNVCVDKSKIHEFELHHPKQEDDDQTDLPLHGYTYMKWPFGSNRTLLTRGQLHGYLKKGEEIQYCNIYAINQWRYTDSIWKNIDTEKSSIFGQEITDSSNRVAKWAIQSIFAGADIMKFIFVSRFKYKQADKHCILSTSTMNTNKFIDLINFKFEEAWNRVKYVVDYLQDKEDGKYMLLKDPIKNYLKIFKVNDEEEVGLDEA